MHKKIVFGYLITMFFIIIIPNPLNPVQIFADDNSTQWDVKHVVGKFLYSNPPKPDQTFNFQYKVENGKLENLTIDQQGSYTAKVSSMDKGIFELKIPRNYPITNTNLDASSKASVYMNNHEINSQNYSYFATDCSFEYSIPFSGNAIISLAYGQYPESIPYVANKVPSHCINETVYNSSMTHLASPLKQIRSGISPEDVVCNSDMTLVLKNTGYSSACVKPDSVSELILLGWAKNPLSSVLSLNNLSLNMSNEQKNKAFYDMMNSQKLKEWSSTGWTFVQTEGIYEIPEKNIHRTYVELYLPPNLGNPKVFCEYGWYAWLTINTETLQVENGTYPEPDSCIKQFQVIKTPL